MKKDKSDLDLARTDLVGVLAVLVVCAGGVECARSWLRLVKPVTKMVTGHLSWAKVAICIV